MEPFAQELLWIVIVGFIISFVLAFAIGANDVANSVSTSVGSGVLTLRQAFILATFCEFLGAILVGNKVSDTMRKILLDVEMYENAEKELMLGCLAALLGSAVWVLLATYIRLPISCSHSIVGSTIGFSLVGRGTRGLNWFVLINIVISWFASPFISGLISLMLFVAIYNFIVLSKHPKRAALRSLPIFYGLTFFINVLGIMLDGPKLLYMDLIPLWAIFVASIAAGLLAALFAQLYFVPTENRRISHHMEERASSAFGSIVPDDESEEVAMLFAFLQKLSAGFGCFAHGGNDVCNAIGPLVAIYVIYSDGSVMQKGETPLWLLAYGGIGIVLGLWIWGHRVIRTIGTDLTEITATTGFCIESGSAVTVLTASKIGLPISTTHCKVGAVVFVGHMTGIYEKRRENEINDATVSSGVNTTTTKTLQLNYINRPTKKKLGVNWGLFRNIVYAWIVTVPATIGLSALFMYILSSTLL